MRAATVCCLALGVERSVSTATAYARKEVKTGEQEPAAGQARGGGQRSADREECVSKTVPCATTTSAEPAGIQPRASASVCRKPSTAPTVLYSTVLYCTVHDGNFFVLFFFVCIQQQHASKQASKLSWVWRMLSGRKHTH